MVRLSEHFLDNNQCICICGMERSFSAQTNDLNAPSGPACFVGFKLLGMILHENFSPDLTLIYASLNEEVCFQSTK